MKRTRGVSEQRGSLAFAARSLRALQQVSVLLRKRNAGEPVMLRYSRTNYLGALGCNAHLDGVVLLLRVHALVHRVREVVAAVLQHATESSVSSPTLGNLN